MKRTRPQTALLAMVMALLSGLTGLSACGTERAPTGGHATQDAIIAAVIDTVQADYAQGTFTPPPPGPTATNSPPLFYFPDLTQVPLETLLPVFPLQTLVPRLLTEVAGTATINLPEATVLLPFTGATSTPVVITVIVTVVHTAEATPSTPIPTVPPLLTSPVEDETPAQGTTAAGPPAPATPTPPQPAPVLPSPTPQPATSPLAVEFAFLQDCGLPTAIFEVRDPLPQSFESAQIYIENTLTGEPLGLMVSDRPFLPRLGACPPGESLLPPEGSAFLAAPVKSPLPSGHTARATIRLCAQDRASGECQQATVDFVIP